MAKRLRRNRFDCIDCGIGVRVDEDGLCAACGRPVVIVEHGVPDYSHVLAGIESGEADAERTEEAGCPCPGRRRITMSDYDHSIHSNPDAAAWAKFFMETWVKNGGRAEWIDESTMLGWFANAMMARHDFDNGHALSKVDAAADAARRSPKGGQT